jgi:hypothetical protein
LPQDFSGEGKVVDHDREAYQHLVNLNHFEDDGNIQPLSSEMQDRAIQDLENYIAFKK